jgi:hypothetical protein
MESSAGLNLLAQAVQSVVLENDSVILLVAVGRLRPVMDQAPDVRVRDDLFRCDARD